MPETVTEEELALLFAIPPRSEPPTEITLFEFGVTETNKGDFLMDELAADMVMRQFADQGVDRLPFDVGHEMLQPKGPDSHRAYGWFVPAIATLINGSKALVATDIQWTAAGAEGLSNREFRFFSPAVLFESESRRITKLINVALVNTPATKNQRPLVLSALEAETETQTKETKETMEKTALLSSLGVADEASAVAKVGELNSAKSELTALLSSIEVESASEAAKAFAEIKKSAETAQAELSAIAKELEEQKLSAAVEAAGAAGKVVNKEFVALLSSEQVEPYLASLPVNSALTAEKIEGAEKQSAQGQTPGATFNADEYL